MDKPYHEPLVPDGIYHLFNRAVGSEKLFVCEGNYFFFLNKYFQHTEKICDTYCYCLLPNHFHFLIRIKSLDKLKLHYEEIKIKQQDFELQIISDFLMERFSNWLNSYTKAFNKTTSRKGGLFMDYTKRQKINNDASFGKLIHYIHSNPVHHGYCQKIEEWKFSSYEEIKSRSNIKLLHDDVLGFFGGVEPFVLFHRQPIHLK